ncbi:uncharacterized protein BO80DRAFT_427716 [Aspergillus ibericus CBS 121593]|uniref:Uncharacterized protein n=1 Tax=Aspergillus ibericus CBS 121593 TaxID=1448316 RepID=A0A395GR57_9EURO|nr:hypothetical protein BO80DRAFT_427716 [Aspergillus ibericus CBS 121593]RAK98025.1 hypothetical protein BO80DRAFT_427716 [Aspergillus ibericus CBS 121593]
MNTWLDLPIPSQPESACERYSFLLAAWPAPNPCCSSLCQAYCGKNPGDRQYLCM